MLQLVAEPAHRVLERARAAVVAQPDRLAVQDHVAHGERPRRLDDRREPPVTSFRLRVKTRTSSPSGAPGSARRRASTRPTRGPWPSSASADVRRGRRQHRQHGAHHRRARRSQPGSPSVERDPVAVGPGRRRASRRAGPRPRARPPPARSPRPSRPPSAPWRSSPVNRSAQELRLRAASPARTAGEDGPPGAGRPDPVAA